VGNLRVGIVNRYTADKERDYPLGQALGHIGATYVPIDVRGMTASLGAQGDPGLTVAGQAGQPDTAFGDLRLDGIVWRVSEDAFPTYADLQWQIARRCVLVNSWRCTRICASKWRTSVELAAAGVRVVPTVLLLPGMKVPAFRGVQTVIKPCVGARGRGVRLAEAGTDPGITEPHVAQPLIRGVAEEQVRALVCGFSSVLAMFRVPSTLSRPGGVRVNNLEAGGVPMLARAEPVRDIARAAASCLGGDLLGVDLVQWNGAWAVLEVNASPGLDGIAQVADVDCYRLAAEAVLSRLRGPHPAAGPAVIPPG
jgi:glutathione synthase/RimK-type ligase-like ATP-grasp enzyme